jgi:hypothetical protein
MTQKPNQKSQVLPLDYPINPATTSGVDLADILNRTFNTMMSNNAGLDRPLNIDRGGLWSQLDVAGDLILYIFDGVNDVKICEVNNGSSSFGGGFEAGTKLLFQQTTAPVGWTKDLSHDNKALRVVSGAVTVGGTVPFTTAFASKAVNGTISGTVAEHTLTTAQIPSHGHFIPSRQYDYGADPSQGASGAAIGSAAKPPADNGTNSEGGGDSHAHGFSGSFNGSAIDMAVQYVDVIIATKD